MIVYVLFAQRTERFEGEHAPECLSVTSEYDMEENPEYLTNEKKKADATGEFDRTEIIALSVLWGDVMARLRPRETVISAQVLGNPNPKKR